jgi:hypothetical protein
MFHMCAVRRPLLRLWGSIANDGLVRFAQVLGFEMPKTMMAAAINCLFNRIDSDPPIIISYGGTSGDNIDGHSRHPIELSQLLLDPECSERRKKLRNVQIDDWHSCSSFRNVLVIFE